MDDFLKMQVIQSRKQYIINYHIKTLLQQNVQSMHVFSLFKNHIRCYKVLYMPTLDKVPFLQLFEAQDLQAKFLQSCTLIHPMISSGIHPKKYFVSTKGQVTSTSL